MTATVSPLSTGDRLEDMVSAALSAARTRGPGTWPTCLVCAESMRVDEIESGVLELWCDSCGSSLSEADESAVELRLVS